MNTKGVVKPYVKFIGASAVGVTQSCYLVRFQKYCILLDCGLYQESDIVTNYKRNQELLKKIKPREIDYIILHEAHIDHTGLVPALYAKGCQAHIMVPSRTTPYLKVLWEDSCKIIMQDCQKISNKHGIKAAPFYESDDIAKALNRCVEIEPFCCYKMTDNLQMTYYPSNHIINACQLSLAMIQGYQRIVLNFTGDIGGDWQQPYIERRAALPFANVTIGENTYNAVDRKNNHKPYDRKKDMEKIVTILNDARRVLIPVFALGRCQSILTVLYNLWERQQIPNSIDVFVDSPMAQKICDLYPHDDEMWDKVYNWERLHFVKDQTETIELQKSNRPMVVLSSAGMLSGGKSVSWAKVLLPDKSAHIIFCGYSSENTLASKIRYGEREIMIEGDLVQNNANITELVSFSSHASRDELMDYYVNQTRYNKLCLVHGDYENKVQFAHDLQNELIKQGKSSRVVCINQDQRIYI